MVWSVRLVEWVGELGSVYRGEREREGERVRRGLDKREPVQRGGPHVADLQFFVLSVGYGPDEMTVAG